MRADVVAMVTHSMEAWNAHDVAGFVACVHPEAVWRPRSTSALTGSEDAYEGHEGVRRWWNEMHQAFDGLYNEVQEIRLVTPDAVLILGTGHAHGRTAGVPLDWDFSMLLEFRGGLVVRGQSWFSVHEGVRAAEALAESQDPS